ncbi:crossover junction endodeoxyribonuclease RuvC [Microbacterium hydrocarbonoxydans]|uniref:crossover junction endodeoxyribonuclease RuvC n=1 Tax=Microbacterium hydrocarbonoxydans TaxID=273678 RepID=UPI00203CBAF8|nr:crossover junction endodeoxyribonuclease RuvC [Microbacterium hydrocarbonoxydans]MCM3780400.1 crossover junction endodeoxyribonuclease RuvC [Microbacterium hydrocarbonoxydans]
MTSSLRVLGIDPGLTRCGVGVVDVDRARRGTLVHVGVIRSSPDAPIGERLAAVASGIREVLAVHRPDAVAVERVFAQQNTHTVMGTAQASGVALLLAAEAGLPAATHTPSEVKAAVTGYGSADKKQVQAMIARILRLDAPPQPADAADALAIALCHAWRRGGASAPGRDALTPAQRAWADAERVARTYVRSRV